MKVPTLWRASDSGRAPEPKPTTPSSGDATRCRRTNYKLVVRSLGTAFARQAPVMPRKANILAVDDKRANLVALDGLLRTDYSVVFAQSGEEAIEILEKRRDIDLLLMDVQMPGMDGFESAARIKQMEAHKDVPIIFITAI